MLFQSDKSGPRAEYFLGLQSALKAANITQPRLIIDQNRLNQNIEQLIKDREGIAHLRIVVKSLPVPQLIEHVSERLGTNRFMTFNLPMLEAVSEMKPDADQLTGKPFSAAAVKQYYANGYNGQVHWLVDTLARLEEYAALANELKITLDVVLEIDAGMHRGGFHNIKAFTDAVNYVHEASNLNLTGVMGYDAHISKAPELFGLRKNALKQARVFYRQSLSVIHHVTGMMADELPVRNAGGSPTFKYHKNSNEVNEIAIGSALMKPTDFDIDHLDAYMPSLFIATPVLKVLGAMKTPLICAIDPIMRVFNRNLATTLFIHGGKWMAQPEDPPGLRNHAIYGHSSNQEVFTGGKRVDIKPDDFVFLRPTQSEAIMMHFGDILLYDGKKITGEWKTFPPSA